MAVEVLVYGCNHSCQKRTEFFWQIKSGEEWLYRERETCPIRDMLEYQWYKIFKHTLILSSLLREPSQNLPCEVPCRYSKNSNRLVHLFNFATSKVGAPSKLHHFQLTRRLSFYRLTKQKIRSLFQFNKTKQNSWVIAQQFEEDVQQLKELCPHMTVSVQPLRRTSLLL